MVRNKWLVVGLLWLVVAVFFGTQGPLQDIMTGGTVDIRTAFISEAFYCLFWFALTPLVLYLAAQFPVSGPRRFRHIVLHTLLAFAVGAAQLALFCFVVWTVGVFPWAQESYWVFLSSFAYVFHLNVLFYIVIMSVDYAVRYYVKSSERELAAVQLESLLTKSRLQNLTMQLQPHFLFNTMNTISVLMREDVGKANRMLLQFSQLLRRTLSTKDSLEATVEEEIAFVREYLEIEQVRFGDRLTVHYDIEPAAERAFLPRLLLQPLVENAIKHGINQQYGSGEIRINIGKRGSRLRLDVWDTGPGRIVEKREQTGTGLSNTSARLKFMYGDDHVFSFTLQEGHGGHVVIEIPFKT